MSRAPRRPLLRACAGGLAALLLAGLWGSGSALALPLHAEEGEGAETAEDAAELVVAAQDPVLSPIADEYGFEVLVRNPAEQELAAGTLTLWLDTERVTSREQLAALGGDAAEAPEDAPAEPLTLLVEAEVGATQGGGEQSLTVAVPRDAIPVFDSGVYAVRAELRPADADVDASTDAGEDTAADAPLAAETAVVWRGPATGEQVPLSIVVPFVLPDDVRTMPTRDDLGRAAPRLDALLTAAERWRATLAVDPRIIAGIRAYGTAAPAAARDLLGRLESSTAPIFLLQFADADPAAEAALGHEELLGPTGLGYLTRLGTFDESAQEPGATAGGTDGAGGSEDGSGASGAQDPGAADETDGPAEDPEEPDPENPLAPGLDQLLSWPSAESGAWPAPGQANATTLQLLHGAGVASLVLRSDNVAGATAPRVTVGGFDALVTDARLDAAARSALAGAAPAERAEGRSVLAAELALAASALSPGLVLGLDRAAVADAEDPAELLDALDALGWAIPTAASELPQGTASLQPGEVSEERAEMLRSAQAASDDIDELAPLLERPGYLTQYQRVRLLEAFSTRYAGAEADLAAAQDRLAGRDRELLAGVQVVPTENTQLVGTESRVPVLVRNSLPFDARITLRVTPTNAAIRLTERNFTDQEVGSEGNSTVLVPVRSRVSSGESGLIVKVADAGNDAVFFDAMLRLTIRSSYETIMLATLGALAALLFGFGVWRSVRRRRSSSVERE